MSLLTSLTDPAYEGSLHVRAAVGEVSTWVAVAGEADVADVRGLDDALSRVPVDATPVVHLDLSELTFADSQAVRRLADFAVRVRASGREVRTSGANRLVRRVATVRGVDDELGLV
jgi:anti-anti-sigma factor